MNEHRNEIDPIRVGLIDTKMDANHEDMEFAPNGILYGKNRNGEGIPPNDHGTHVAGAAADV